ncbi:MAG: AF1514 family protein [Deltaproteobacteria bacterium]|nr:AF1514 family protein [Deltaproteobacteria bacterium]MBI4796147.1 AF1514 family protein [Deltaproteobacteria bacterium]
MTTCPTLRREMLPDPVDLRLEDDALDFPRAKQAADHRARKLCADPMLLAWFDQAAGQYSPNIVCCREDLPSWLVYGLSRGGDLIIDINAEAFIFVYRRG